MMLDCLISDLLIHTGDFAHAGTPPEIVAFGRWLGEKLSSERGHWTKYPLGVFLV